MSSLPGSELTEKMIEKAISLGAAMAGIASVKSLKDSPSHRLYPKIGCIGMNNLVITPEYGPRIRFRALLLNREAGATGPVDFHPCEGCAQACRKACPVKAFQNTVYSADAMGQSILPGVNGTYDRVTCNVKMGKDIEDAVMAIPAGDDEHQEVLQAIDEFEQGIKSKPHEDKQPLYCVKYCRECELVCPVGI